MTKKMMLLPGVFLVLLLMITESFAVEMGVITGGVKGTYYQFGLNMGSLAAKHGIRLNAMNSNGSVENIYAVYKRPGTQMGIVQSDVLAFVSKVRNDAVLKRIARKIKMVFPLYNEEVHILGQRGISDFDDLAGKRVAVGKEGSGTYLTAKLLFEISEIVPSEQIAVGTDDALKMLKAGELDAMFYVAGYPVKLFSESVSEADNLAVIPVLNKNIIEFYPRSVIPEGTYSWQKEDLNTVAVKAVLVSYDFRRNNCTNVGRFARILYDNQQWLIENGHPKWKSVDFDFPLKGWEQYDCVRRQLATHAQQPAKKKKQGNANPVLDAIKEVL